jgi:hypothetical protein
VPLHPDKVRFEECVGKTTEIYHYDCTLRLKNGLRPSVRLMLLLMAPPKEITDGGLGILPVGQEIIATGGEALYPESQQGEYCTVLHRNVLFHAILVKRERLK